MNDRPAQLPERDDDAFIELALCYLDGLATHDEAAKLDAILRADAQRRDQLINLAMQARAVAETVRPPAQAQTLSQQMVLDEEGSDILMEVLEIERQSAHRRAAERAQDAAARADDETARYRAQLLFSQPSPSAPVRHIVIPKAVVYTLVGGIGAIAAALVLMVAQSFMSEPAVAPAPQLAQTPPAPSMPAAQPVARIIASADAQWEDASDRRRLPVLAHEPIVLRRGMVKLRFDTGAEVILNAPIEVVPISAGELRLVKGELVGRCVVDAARGFTVQTANARVVDLGTEFGVRITDTGATEAHVFDGEVMLTAMSEGSDRVTLALKGGMAGRVNHEGTRIVEAPAAAHTFVSDAEFEAHVMAQEGSAYHRALAHRYQIARHPHLLAYYTFEADTMQDGRTLNQALATRGKFDAVLRGSPADTAPRTVVGRFAREQALDFMPRGTETVWAQVEHDAAFETLEELTLTAWVERSPHDGGTILSKRETDTDVSLQMALFGPTRDPMRRNAMQFGSGNASTLDAIFHHTEPITQSLAGWRFVVATYKDGEVRMYLDGRLIDRGEIAAPLGHSRAPLLIGAAPLTLAWSGADPFHGSIDEVAIFSRALSDDEIAAMYEASAP